MSRTDDQAPAAAGGNRNLYPPSPCVSVCTLDDAGSCMGCGRTVEQIAGWARMSKAEQWAVIDELAAREGRG